MTGKHVLQVGAKWKPARCGSPKPPKCAAVGKVMAATTGVSAGNAVLVAGRAQL